MLDYGFRILSRQFPYVGLRFSDSVETVSVCWTTVFGFCRDSFRMLDYGFRILSRQFPYVGLRFSDSVETVSVCWTTVFGFCRDSFRMLDYGFRILSRQFPYVGLRFSDSVETVSVCWTTVFGFCRDSFRMLDYGFRILSRQFPYVGLRFSDSVENYGSVGFCRDSFRMLDYGFRILSRQFPYVGLRFSDSVETVSVCWTTVFGFCRDSFRMLDYGFRILSRQFPYVGLRFSDSVETVSVCWTTVFGFCRDSFRMLDYGFRILSRQFPYVGLRFSDSVETVSVCWTTVFGFCRDSFRMLDYGFRILSRQFPYVGLRFSDSVETVSVCWTTVFGFCRDSFRMLDYGFRILSRQFPYVGLRFSDSVETVSVCWTTVFGFCRDSFRMLDYGFRILSRQFPYVGLRFSDSVETVSLWHRGTDLHTKSQQRLDSSTLPSTSLSPKAFSLKIRTCDAELPHCSGRVFCHQVTGRSSGRDQRMKFENLIILKMCLLAAGPGVEYSQTVLTAVCGHHSGESRLWIYTSNQKILCKLRKIKGKLLIFTRVKDHIYSSTATEANLSSSSVTYFSIVFGSPGCSCGDTSQESSDGEGRICAAYDSLEWSHVAFICLVMVFWTGRRNLFPGLDSVSVIYHPFYHIFLLTASVIVSLTLTERWNRKSDAEDRILPRETFNLGNGLENVVTQKAKSLLGEKVLECAHFMSAIMPEFFVQHEYNVADRTFP
ncbi:hypothetical protein RRG08_019236 [Elysia crispata]|uniref:Uncharacterized protein n=1 Tax=Elysia crispata TaxID=231223 RepID=A0AAE1E5J0_9GAST|nr:hypothetical protein RRG08_019236 [Elysia crispata]